MTVKLKSYSHYYKWHRKKYPHSKPYRGYYRTQYNNMCNKTYLHDMTSINSRSYYYLSYLTQYS